MKLCFKIYLVLGFVLFHTPPNVYSYLSAQLSVLLHYRIVSWKKASIPREIMLTVNYSL